MKFNRLVYLSNNLFIHIVYRKFLRHPEVTDLETNVNVGSGFGMARTTDPLTQIFRVLRYMNWKFSPFRKSFSLLDLGCGDGFMLKAFDFAGFRNLSGVEIDSELADLSRKNVPRASIASLDFSSSDFVQFAKKGNFKAVFTFNPAPAAQLIPALRALAQEPYILFFRNPISATEIITSPELNVKIIARLRNMIIFRISLSIENAR
jgi:hypothetical protein